MKSIRCLKNCRNDTRSSTYCLLSRSLPQAAAVNFKPLLFERSCSTTTNANDQLPESRNQKDGGGDGTTKNGGKMVDGNIINGKVIAEQIKEEIRNEINHFLSSHPKRRRPHLSVMLIGNDPASIVYVQNKQKAATAAGITCDILRLPQTVTEPEIKKEINVLNRDNTVDGVIVQLPLPGYLNERLICDSVLPEKDVDGFNVLNVGRFCVDEKAFIPATPLGVLELLSRLKIDTHGKNAVVCGRSKNVGLPIALHLLASKYGDRDAGNATTTVCHRHTPRSELKVHTQRADIVITATGMPGLITADMVKEGAIIIDIGITRIKEAGKYKLIGDVDFNNVKEKASLITPVPGGVGPITVAMILKNTLRAYRKEIKFHSSNLQHNANLS